MVVEGGVARRGELGRWRWRSRARAGGVRGGRWGEEKRVRLWRETSAVAGLYGATESGFQYRRRRRIGDSMRRESTHLPQVEAALPDLLRPSRPSATPAPSVAHRVLAPSGRTAPGSIQRTTDNARAIASPTDQRLRAACTLPPMVAPRARPATPAALATNKRQCLGCATPRPLALGSWCLCAQHPTYATDTLVARTSPVNPRRAQA